MFEKSINCSSIFIFLLIAMFAGAIPVANANQSEMDVYFNSLQQRLTDDGFDQNKIRALYRQPEISFETRSVSLFFIHREGKMDHSQYTDTQSIRKAKKYMQTHKTDLVKIETGSGVQKTVVTAIILVETRLGTTLGTSSTFNALSSIAALENKAARDKVWKSLDSESYLTRQAFVKTAKKKFRWAYRELKAFLEYTQKEKMNPLAIKGSFAGAMGIPQFMPTNIEHYAKDGNGDGSIDLFNHADAMASIANYLKRHGWKPGIGRKKKKKIVHHYNHSSDYVDTIIKISDLLET